MSEKIKWKDALLRSNMPLEFEAARMLVAEGFAVNSDFRYSWNDSAERGESSVDLHAKTGIPFEIGKDPAAQIELLTDCTHRAPNTAALFLPDPNLPEISPVSPGHTIRVIDQFSPYIIEPDAVTVFESDLSVCYKGMEIDLKTGEVDNDLYQHGLQRLRNPLPRLFTENVMNFMTGSRSENIPFLFCPIFLTTSPLYVLRKDVTLEEIANADKLEEVGISVPYLIMYANLSPKFKTVCVNECRQMREILRTEKGMEIEMKKVRYYNNHFNLPFTIIDALTVPEYYFMNAFFSQFFVCSSKHFHDLVTALKKTIIEAVETRKILV